MSKSCYTMVTVTLTASVKNISFHIEIKIFSPAAKVIGSSYAELPIPVEFMIDTAAFSPISKLMVHHPVAS
ncbi:MAG: hypothetical protein IKL86_03825 [Clostridia bacterium]|nr:hypothetical protein [Clostridia bacterium]